MPLQRLLDRHLYLGSRKWELEQRAKEAKAKQSGDIAPVGFNRDFRILVAARGTEEREAMRLLRLLQDKSEMWSLLPESDRTTEMASIAFRMSSEAGSLVEKLVAGPHDRPPF